MCFYAQGVTVGAGIKPQPGAMLDMKSIKVGGGSHNSSLGLMLPRAALLELDKLYPMFAKKAADGVTVFPVPAEPTGDYTPDKQAAHA